MKKIFYLILLFVGITLSACNFESNQNSKPQVMVSIIPQKYFVQRVAGDMVDVNVMIGEGYEPATYEPTPNDIQKIHHTDLYFRIGQIGFEKTQMDKLANINPNMKIIDTSKNIQFLLLDNGLDPHIWLSPKLVIEQVRVITEALSNFDPINAQKYRSNSQVFINELEQLDAELAEIFKPLVGKKIFVYHPAFGYLANAYGFEQEYFQIEGKQPTVQQINNIINQAKRENIKIVFVQKQFDTKSAETIANEIGGKVVALNPLEYDYIKNMKEMGKKILGN